MPSEILRAVLTSPPQIHASLAAFDDTWGRLATRWPLPVDQAILGGVLADRLGYAFAAGYAAALRRLVPGLEGRACLCITEEGGAHPRAIRTALTPDGDGWTVTGRKQWSTLAGSGDVLLVAASAGAAGDRNDLRLVRVRRAAPGVTLTPMPETPFTPEIPHFEVAFDGVAVESVLPGDGWARYIRPFRTIEDAHVCAAAVAYLLGVNRSWTPRLVGLLVALRTLALAPPDDPAVHVALGGCLTTLSETVATLDWSGVDPGVAARWQRDAGLLRVANRARTARLAAAWARLAD